MTRYRDHPLASGHPPPWATSWGEDPYGVFAGFAVDGVEQRLRWIHPGAFWMGSPEDEPGRDDDEDRHRVTLTKGFWLADTPCTQALWQAVMGTNPSRFQTPERPVEQVHWGDVQDFVARLNQRHDGLDARLPTEAEWEYACRAATEEATFAGPLEILGTRNAPVLDSIAWYGGNSGVDTSFENAYDSSDWPEKQEPHTRAASHPVARKAQNPWGLYDMLGNVWEWCSDWYGPYRHNEAPDPSGVAEVTFRVVRGGSWFFDARFVRAAYRNHLEPSYRSFNLGFRLALGQVEPVRAERQGRDAPTSE